MVECYFEENPCDVIALVEESFAWRTIMYAKVKAVFEMLQFPKGSRVLDVGCGVGFPAITHFFSQIELISIDISKTEVKMAKLYRYLTSCKRLP